MNEKLRTVTKIYIRNEVEFQLGTRCKAYLNALIFLSISIFFVDTSLNCWLTLKRVALARSTRRRPLHTVHHLWLSTGTEPNLRFIEEELATISHTLRESLELSKAKPFLYNILRCLTSMLRGVFLVNHCNWYEVRSSKIFQLKRVIF